MNWYWIGYETSDGKDQVVLSFDEIDGFLNRLMASPKYIQDSVIIMLEVE